MTYFLEWCHRKHYLWRQTWNIDHWLCKLNFALAFRHFECRQNKSAWCDCFSWKQAISSWTVGQGGRCSQRKLSIVISVTGKKRLELEWEWSSFVDISVGDRESVSQSATESLLQPYPDWTKCPLVASAWWKLVQWLHVKQILWSCQIFGCCRVPFWSVDRPSSWQLADLEVPGGTSKFSPLN